MPPAAARYKKSGSLFGCFAVGETPNLFPAEGLAPFAGVLFFYTHGHHYGVKMGTDRLAESAGERGADVALFGHTHRRALVRGIGTAATVFNPGSLRDGGSYGVITVTDGECQFGWRRVPEF